MIQPNSRSVVTLSMTSIPKVIFYDFPDLENFSFKFHDFPDFSRTCTNPALTRPMKNRLEEMRTLNAGRSKAEPKILPHRRPLPVGTGWPKFNQLEMVTTFTYKPSLVRINACNFKLLW